MSSQDHAGLAIDSYSDSYCRRWLTSGSDSIAIGQHKYKVHKVLCHHNTARTDDQGSIYQRVAPQESIVASPWGLFLDACQTDGRMAGSNHRLVFGRVRPDGGAALA